MDSIAALHKDLLYRIYRLFYHPTNMALFIAGDMDPAEALQRVEDNQARKEFGPAVAVERIYPPEPPQVAETRVEERMAVATPLLRLGFKDPHPPRELLRTNLATALALEAALGPSSRLYDRWYQEGLIDESFGFEYVGEAGIGHAVIGGRTPEPQRLYEELMKAWAHLGEEGLPAEAVERQRRNMMGTLWQQADSLQWMGHQTLQSYFRGVDLQDAFEVLQSLDIERVRERVRTLFRQERQVLSLILPMDDS